MGAAEGISEKIDKIALEAGIEEAVETSTHTSSPAWPLLREARAGKTGAVLPSPLFTEKHPTCWVGPMKFATKPAFPKRSFVLLALTLASALAGSGCIGAARARVQASKPAPQQTLLSPLPSGISPDFLASSSTGAFC